MPIYSSADLIQLTKTVKSILLFGPPFTGKTRSLWTLAAYLKSRNLGKLRLYDLDLKCESLVEKCRKEDLLDQLEVVRLGVRDDLTGGTGRFGMNKSYFEAFQQDINSLHKQVDFATGKWKTTFQPPGAVILDSLSAYCDIAMQWVLGTLGHQLNAEKTDARDDYGRAMSKIMETIKSVKSLPCITGWIAHAELMQSGLDGKIVRLPVVTGRKLAPQLAKEFNYTIYCPPPIKVDNRDTYRWQVRGGENGVESAGTTGRDDLPTFIEPDFRKVFND